MSTRAYIAEAPNRGALWARLLVEEFVRGGVGLFVVAPGSRSAPLAAAVAAHPRAQSLVHFDERGGAFAALGWARATGRSAALVTTSGTAVANALPAAVEADRDGVPLLLLTADRPPELRDTGANQTIRQPGLFGSTVRWAFDVPPASADVPLAFVLTTAAHAVARSLAPAGPVHLNWAAREPLGPAATGEDFSADLALLERWLSSNEPYTQHTVPNGAPPPAVVVDLAGRLAGIERGLVVLGKTDRPDAAAAAARLAGALGWPLLPDVGSHARGGPMGPPAAPLFDLVLAGEGARDTLRPEAVLHLGGPMVSKRLNTLVERARPALHVVVRPDPFRFDPMHAVTERFEADPALFADALAAALPTRPQPSDWSGAWRAASDAVAAELDAAFAEDDRLTEPRVARLVSEGLLAGHGLVLAASMPVRDFDTFASPRTTGREAARVATNRGASGIDGTVATAAGFARGLGASVTLVVGDLALLHDLNSLALLRDGPPVVVVAVNNDGGGIFHFLPVARHAAPRTFERMFGTPHGLAFEDAARMFGLAYARPETADAFARTYADACASGRSALIEVRTERASNVEVHRALVARCGAAADRTLGS